MKKIVIKIGSSSIVKNDGQINKDNVKKLVSQIANLKNKGIDVCLVSSGAISVGINKLGLQEKPKDISKKQACAATGQMSLMQEYEQIFDEFNIKCAQILLNHDDFGNRKRMTYLSNTLNALFSYGVVPVVNENDALAVEEIKVGDNDSISAMMSLAIGADLLILVSDVDGLYTANPKTNKDATLIKVVDKIDDDLYAIAGGSGSKVGTGGMKTKLNAGVIVNNAGIDMMITNRTKLESLSKVADGEFEGTLFKGSKDAKNMKQNWLIHCANLEGSILIDEGADKAVKERRSLLSCGILKVEGQFNGNEVVKIVNEKGEVTANGIVSFNSDEIKELLRDKTNTQVVIHANNIAILEDK